MWDPQPGAQSSALLADWCDEIFYGGERGGGKSDFQLGYQEDGALEYGSGHRGIITRKTYDELEELQLRAQEIYPQTGAVYKTQASADYKFSNCWYWPNGATVKMRYIEKEKDYGRYHGHQYTRISMDEVTEYATPDGLLKMMSTLRSAQGVPCSIRLTGNPGGVGHHWVKERYIDVSPPLHPYTDPDSEFTRMFIPSRLQDNVILLENDPNYSKRIRAATQGNEALRKAWEEGDWDIIAGAFFSNWSQQMILAPFRIPEHWTKARSFDWGSAKPFSAGWWAVASEDYLHQGQVIPKGALIKFREWYGVAKDKTGKIKPNVGLKLTADKVGDGIRKRTDEEINYSVADPSVFTEDGGPSLAERMKIPFMPADNKRVASKGHIGGWDQMSSRMEGEDGRPMLYFFNTCRDSIRTIPMLQHDEKRIEDLNSDMEDHAADECRYMCMSRPYTKPSPEDKPKDDRWAKAFKRQKAETWRTI